MRVDYIAKAIITAEHSTKAQRKLLKPADRKLLLLCCETWKNKGYIHKDKKIQAQIKELNVKKHEIKDLIVTLTKNTPPIAARKGFCHLISSIFKVIANLFHLRIGIGRLDKNLHAAFDQSFSANPLSNAYEEIISSIKKTATLSPKQRHFALNTIESFYLLVTHRNFFERYPEALKESYIRENCGLKTTWESTHTFKNKANLLRTAPQLLHQKYLQAKNAKKLNEFFEQAFNVADKTLNARFRRLIDFDKMPENKGQTLLGIYQTFVEMQFKQYQRDNKPKFDPKPGETFFMIKERIAKEENFLINYVNRENFEKYLLNVKGIIGKKCLDGEINEKELPKLIDEILGKQEGIRIILIQPFGEEFAVVSEDADELIAEPLDPEIEKTYIEILEEANKYPHRLKRTDPHNNKIIDPILHTIEAIYKLAKYKKCILKKFELTPEEREQKKNATGQNLVNIQLMQQEERQIFATKAIGLVIHAENSETDTKEVIENAQRVLFDAYNGAKEKGELQQFFDECFSFFYACVEGRVGLLQDYLIQLEALKNLDAALAPPFIPIIDNKKTKVNHIYDLVPVFVELQAREYAKANNILLDASWLKVNGTKFQILNHTPAFKQFVTSQRFKKFLRDEVKIVDKEAKDGKFTEADVAAFAQFCVDNALIEYLGN